MGWLIDKPQLKWREPREAWRIIQTQQFSKGSFAKSTLIVFALLMISWFLATLNPNKTPVPFLGAVGLALVGAIVIIGIHWLMLWFAPSEIRITAKSVIRIIGNSQRIWKYSQIKSYSFDVLQSASKPFTILLFQHHKGRNWKIALDDSVDKTKLKEILFEHGIPKLEQPT
jgi:hypothetical protein